MSPVSGVRLIPLHPIPNPSNRLTPPSFRLSIKGPVAASPLIRDLINEIMNTEYVQRFDGSMVLLYHYKNAGHEKGEWATTMPKGKAWLEFGYPVRLDYHPKGTET